MGVGGYRPVYDKGLSPNRDYERLGKVLVNDASTWEAMLADWRLSGRRVCSFDTETAAQDRYAHKPKWGAAALSPEHSFLVGCSLAFGPDRGYYLPFGHRVGKNLPIEAFVELEKVLLSAGMVVYWNAKHDLRIQRVNGHSRWREISVFDASVLVWNCDTNAGSPSLKEAARQILGWEMATFDEAIGESPDLSWMSPGEALDYGVLDALAPLHLMRACRDVWRTCRSVIDLDQAVLWPVLDMEDRIHPIDLSVAEGVLEGVEPALDDLRLRMCDVIGDPSYDPGKACTNSATRDALQRLGVRTGEMTTTGRMSLSESALLDIRDEHEFVELILQYRSLGNMRSKIEALMRDYQSDLGGSRFQYLINQVATARFSSGNQMRNPYFAGYGIQNVYKAPKVPYLATPMSEGRVGVEVCDWVFECLDVERLEGGGKALRTQDGLRVEENGSEVHGILTEGFIKDGNIRRAFVPGKGRLFLHVDYAAEELRIPANLSGDKRMISIFLEGQDIHKITAEALFGAEGYDSAARKRAKPISFGMLYGCGPGLIASRVGCSVAEAEAYMDRWWRLYPSLRQWVDEQVRHGKRYGYVLTALGRRRWVKRWYEESGAVWKARNLSMNSPVQGTAGEIMRLAVVKIHRNLLPKYGDGLRMLSMVHDEINFGVKREVLWNAMDDIVEQMDVKLSGWKVPMVAEFEVGTSWGETFPFEKRDGVWCPSGDEV